MCRDGNIQCVCVRTRLNTLLCVVNLVWEVCLLPYASRVKWIGGGRTAYVPAQHFPSADFELNRWFKLNLEADGMACVYSHDFSAYRPRIACECVYVKNNAKKNVRIYSELMRYTCVATVVFQVLGGAVVYEAPRTVETALLAIIPGRDDGIPWFLPIRVQA